MQEDFAFRPGPPIVVPEALEPMEMIMWEASPPIGLRYGLLSEEQPGPMSTSSRPPWPLSSRTVRHRFPSAVRVNVTPGPRMTVLTLSSSPAATGAVPVMWLVGPAAELWLRRAAEMSEVADDVPEPGPTALPSEALPPEALPSEAASGAELVPLDN